MGAILDSASEANLTRRRFLTLSAGAAALAGLSMQGCSSKKEPVATVDEPTAASANTVTEHPEPVDTEGGATWVTAACWHNCGGRCLNKVLVKDGVVLRQKTDDTHEDSPDFPQ